MFEVFCNKCSWSGGEHDLILNRDGRDAELSCPSCDAGSSCLADGFVEIATVREVIKATHNGNLGVLFYKDEDGFNAIDETITLYQTICDDKPVFYHITLPTWELV